MSDKITVMFDMRDFPEHKKLRDAKLHPEVEKFLEVLAQHDCYVTSSEETLSRDEILRLVHGISTSRLQDELDDASARGRAGLRELLNEDD